MAGRLVTRPAQAVGPRKLIPGTGRKGPSAGPGALYPQALLAPEPITGYLSTTSNWYVLELSKSMPVPWQWDWHVRVQQGPERERTWRRSPPTADRLSRKLVPGAVQSLRGGVVAPTLAPSIRHTSVPGHQADHLGAWFSRPLALARPSWRTGCDQAARNSRPVLVAATRCWG